MVSKEICGSRRNAGGSARANVAKLPPSIWTTMSASCVVRAIPWTLATRPPVTIYSRPAEFSASSNAQTASVDFMPGVSW